MLMTTIAQDIANCNPAFATDIGSVIESKLALASVPLNQQYEELIAKPLQHHHIERSIVVVINALDESGSTKVDSDLLSILCTEANWLPPQFCIFITSRPTRSIQQRLSRLVHITGCNIDTNLFENGQDIVVYVDVRLKTDKILSEMVLDQTLINELKIRMEGLFIWVSTIFSYLLSVYNPTAKLHALLLNPTTAGLVDAKMKMDALYTTILDTCGPWHDQEFLNDYQLIMGAVVGVSNVLPSTERYFDVSVVAAHSLLLPRRCALAGAFYQ